MMHDTRKAQNPGTQNAETQNAETQSEKLYRPCVGLMLLNARDEAFVGRRIDHPSSYWQMPQGGIEDGEEPLQAAWREMGEEIGSVNAFLLAEHAEWLRYDLPPSLRATLWDGRYCGQRQRWFLFRFLGADKELSVATEQPEFSQWRWLALESLASTIVPFKREVYARVVSFARKVLSEGGGSEGGGSGSGGSEGGGGEGG